MRVGCPKEIKNNEFRVGLTPESAAELVAHGHDVLIETGAGAGIGADDAAYAAAGAAIAADAAAVFAQAEMIVKVKEPQAAERAMLRPGQVLFTYLHLAPDPAQTRDLMASGAVCIAYETVTGAAGGLPLLRPMSQVAGRMAVQAGASALEKAHGGRGVLLGGVPGVRRGKVAILGGGVVGTNAAKIAVGMGADVTVLDISQNRLVWLDDIFGNSLQTLFSSRANIEAVLRECDLLIGAVLVPGASAPRLVSRADLALMKPGAVVVDVAIDQGGCLETSKPTSHDDPVYTVDGVLHYTVANMPGAVSLTSTMALTNQTLPFGLKLANQGFAEAVRQDPALRQGVNTYKGHITHPAVAASLGMPYVDMGTL